MSSEQTARVDYYLKIIEKNLDPNKLVNPGALTDYYQATGWAYRVFHSPEGAIHMAINPDGIFDPKGYRVQADYINQYIHPEMNVLELGAGTGFNTDLLSKNNPNVNFTVSDITPAQVKRMTEKFQGRKNVRVKTINYQQIPEKSDSFDLVFLVETFCHSPNPKEALLEIKRVLKPGGKLIIFDAWATPLSDKKEWYKASRMAMESMAVEKGWYINEFRQIAQEEMKLLKEVDYTEDIIPCLNRLHDLAWRFLRRPRLVKITKKIVPLTAQNSIAGLLMPDLFGSGAWRYKLLVLEK